MEVLLQRGGKNLFLTDLNYSRGKFKLNISTKHAKAHHVGRKLQRNCVRKTLMPAIAKGRHVLCVTGKQQAFGHTVRETQASICVSKTKAFLHRLKN